ncbi:MAG: squalene/phytoene synthase family protein, partial [Methyloligellaceae bacterium]
MDTLVRECQQRIRKGSKSFAGAAMLFPADIRDDTYLLYAWCRYCDDLIDGQEFGRVPTKTAAEHGDSTSVRLEQLQHQTREALRGHATEPVFLALQRVVQKHRIANVHPMDHL